ncbi:ubiquitin-like domain-containing protein, partial [Candidatus Saccharibacteria bacterium]|nr:ubiquitin-like domain-containing protein [Candidatus Saccharibacteria bacterium]
MVGMKLSRKFEQVLILVGVSVMAIVFGFLLKMGPSRTFADTEEKVVVNEDANFVTFYDEGEKLTIKTNARTVADALVAAEVIINSGDKVEPGLETEINADNF